MPQTPQRCWKDAPIQKDIPKLAVELGVFGCQPDDGPTADKHSSTSTLTSTNKSANQTSNIRLFINQFIGDDLHWWNQASWKYSLEDILGTGFDIHCNLMSQITVEILCEIYTRPGTHVGFENNCNSWTWISMVTMVSH